MYSLQSSGKTKGGRACLLELPPASVSRRRPSAGAPFPCAATGQRNDDFCRQLHHISGAQRRAATGRLPVGASCAAAAAPEQKWRPKWLAVNEVAESRAAPAERQRRQCGQRGATVHTMAAQLQACTLSGGKNDEAPLQSFLHSLLLAGRPPATGGACPAYWVAPLSALPWQRSRPLHTVCAAALLQCRLSAGTQAASWPPIFGSFLQTRLATTILRAQSPAEALLWRLHLALLPKWRRPLESEAGPPLRHSLGHAPHGHEGVRRLMSFGQLELVWANSAALMHINSRSQATKQQGTSGPERARPPTSR